MHCRFYKRPTEISLKKDHLHFFLRNATDEDSVHMSETTSNLCKNKEIVDLFCGGGGFTTGALAAGWKVVLAVEGDEKIASIYKKNNEEHDVRVLLIDEETGPLLAREIR